jgi:hypothetical protein
MMKFIIVIILSFAEFCSCKQSGKPTTGTVEAETVNSMRQYEYADSAGNRLVIYNSFPKGGGYVDTNGKRHPYVVFYTKVLNETMSPVEFEIEFPKDSFEFPPSSGVHMNLFIPPDTMTTGKVSLTDYGLSVNSFVATGINRPGSMKRIVNPGDSTAFYVVVLSGRGVDGTLRAGFDLRGQNLFYKIFAYKSIPGHPLMAEMEIDCGSVGLQNMMLRE